MRVRPHGSSDGGLLSVTAARSKLATLCDALVVTMALAPWLFRSEHDPAAALRD